VTDSGLIESSKSADSTLLEDDDVSHPTTKRHMAAGRVTIRRIPCFL